MEDIKVWNFSHNCFCDVISGILGSEGKTSDLAAHFSRSSSAVNTVLFTIETFNKHSRMAKLSEPRPYAMKHHKIMLPMLTRAPLGYFYNAPHLGGGGLFRAPPLISETTGPNVKIQAAFESPGKTVEGKQILLTSGSRVTSQVRSKSKCSTFRAWWHRRAKLRY